MAEVIPLSEQAVQHLSPGCRCAWSTFYDTDPSTVGITGQADDCRVHPKIKQRRDDR